jgi:pimeloyl-ACP methyl ester carboxylesterase
VLDVLAGISFLEAEGITSVALVGHSFGGAVAINAAAISPIVRTCIPMSTQTFGAEPAWRLGPRCSLLLAHGTADEILPPSCSEYVFRIAKEPKELLLKEGARHGLDEWADELPGILRDWITRHLPRETDSR